MKPTPPGATKELLTGQFYPPTVLLNVTHDMKIMKEEVFGPVLSICKVKSDEEAIRLANDCEFGLGSNVFAGSKKRAEKLGQQLEAGMTSVNDFCSTYMAQSLPFGGVKESGFDRFAAPKVYADAASPNPSSSIVSHSSKPTSLRRYSTQSNRTRLRFVNPCVACSLAEVFSKTLEVWRNSSVASLGAEESGEREEMLT